MFALYNEEALRKIHDNAIRKEEREKGIAEGIKEGISAGIRNLISSCREFNIDDTAIQQKIISKYNLTPERAQAYMQQ